MPNPSHCLNDLRDCPYLDKVLCEPFIRLWWLFRTLLLLLENNLTHYKTPRWSPWYRLLGALSPGFLTGPRIAFMHYIQHPHSSLWVWPLDEQLNMLNNVQLHLKTWPIFQSISRRVSFSGIGSALLINMAFCSGPKSRIWAIWPASLATNFPFYSYTSVYLASTELFASSHGWPSSLCLDIYAATSSRSSLAAHRQTNTGTRAMPVIALTTPKQGWHTARWTSSLIWSSSSCPSRWFGACSFRERKKLVYL